MVGPLSRRAFLAASTGVAAAAAVPAGMASARELGEVVRVAIHPALGVARVGNSEDAFSLAPEVPSGIPAGPYKDAAGAMAKQAARFRIYGYDRDGKVVGEITAADADITWTVQVGNAKAAWYGANEPLDLPSAEPVPMRNPTVADRRSLAVVSRRRVVSGAGASPKRLDGGSFGGTAVDFGEVFTDRRGRLIVMPGSGAAISAQGAPPLSGFADNDGWTDTTCDGPIRATVRIGGRTLEAEPARVLCGSPNYGPAIGAGLVTVYDDVVSALTMAGRRSMTRTQFHRDVAPIFARMSDTQWVNEGYATRFGAGSLRDWASPAWQARLQDRSPANRPLRRAILAMFRDPSYSSVQPSLEPQLYGDLVAIPPDRTEPRQWLSLTPIQYAHLRTWANGAFTLGTKPARTFDAIRLADQPAALDRAGLDACLGGAFHPGVEFPWLARVPWLWTDDLRLRSAANEPNVRDYGPFLTPGVAMDIDGPLASLGPGDLVKWMGVPWQADSSSCRYGYQKPVSPVLPGFWPARIPNSVLTEEDYAIVVDTSRTLAERRAAFRRRAMWERPIATTNRLATLSLMVTEWSRLGVVAERPGPKDGAFPARMKVESRIGFSGPQPDVPAWAIRPQMSLFPLIVTNSDDDLLRSVAQDGTVQVLATSAALGRPECIAADAMGTLFVACTNAGAIVRVAMDGTTTPIASGLAGPIGVAVDPYGPVYACGTGSPDFASTNGWVVKIDPDGTVTSLPVPSGPFTPHAVAVAPDGALLVADQVAGRIVRIDPLLGVLLDANWIAGLQRPKNMAWDSDGALYIVQRAINTVTRYDPDGGQLPFTLEGSALDGPFGIAFDGMDAMYVSSAGPTANRIDRIALAGDRGVVSTFATGMANPGGIVMRG